MPLELAATERTTTTASLQSNALFSDHLPNDNNPQNTGERTQKLRQTVIVLQAHVWIGKCCISDFCIEL